MSERGVAERYAELRGLGFVGKGVLPVRSPWLGGDLRCMNAITGPIADLVQGIVFESTGVGAGGLIGRPSAQFEIAGLSEAVEGLWVRRSGVSIWTRVMLPRGYKEMRFSNEAFMARYRVAVSADRDGRFARLLLSDVLVGWLLERAPQEEGFQAIGTSFELWRGVVFVRGPLDAFKSLEKLAGFAAAAAQIADCVQTVVSALRQVSPPAPAALDGSAEASRTAATPSPAAVQLPAAGSRSLDRRAYGAVADKIEAELRAFGAWEGSAPEGLAQGAFGWPGRSFTQWLQYDLLPRLRGVAAGREDPPQDSMVGTRALREFDGFQDAAPLIDALLELDRLVDEP